MCIGHLNCVLWSLVWFDLTLLKIRLWLWLRFVVKFRPTPLAVDGELLAWLGLAHFNFIPIGWSVLSSMLNHLQTDKWRNAISLIPYLLALCESTIHANGFMYFMDFQDGKMPIFVHNEKWKSVVSRLMPFWHTQNVQSIFYLHQNIITSHYWKAKKNVSSNFWANSLTFNSFFKSQWL